MFIICSFKIPHWIDPSVSLMDEAWIKVGWENKWSISEEIHNIFTLINMCELLPMFNIEDKCIACICIYFPVPF